MASPKTIAANEAAAERLRERGFVPIGRYKGQMRWGRPCVCPRCKRGFAFRDGGGPAVSVDGVLYHQDCLQRR